MIRNFTSKLLALLLSIAFFTACNNDDNTPGNFSEDNHYLTGIITERQISKAEIVAQIMEYAGGLNIDLPETVLSSLLCDVEVAAITYNTTGVDGTPVTASGVIAMPRGTTSYDHLLSIQHGTLDMEEAPSIQLFYYEMMPVVSGHVVVMADYLGYGSSQTPDRQHPYLHARLTGSTCADMIEAAREYLREKSITEENEAIELIGYSQGGQATIATLLELENRGKADEIRAVHAGGGAYDLESILQSFLENETPTSYSRSGYLPYLIRGMIYGERLSVQDENLYASELIDRGVNQIFSTLSLSQWHSALGSDITQILHPDFFAAPSFNGNADVLAVIAALQKNSLVNATAKPQTTIQLYHSPKDELVPYSNAVSAHQVWPSSTLTDLTMPSHVFGGVEFMLRYMNLWQIISPFL